MVEQIFLSSQGKQGDIVSNKLECASCLTSYQKT